MTLVPAVAAATVVGSFTKVMGPVDLLKVDKPQWILVKEQDGVEPRDMVRTGSISKAQITFVDDTVLTLASGSQIAIEEYWDSTKKGEGQAVLQVLRGLVHSLVTPITRKDEPSFLIKTHTAVLAVRGTGTYIEINPTGTNIYNESGQVRVCNILPTCSGHVDLGPMEYSRVEMGRPPTPAMPFGGEVLNELKNRLEFKEDEADRGRKALCRAIFGLLSERAWLLDWLVKYCDKEGRLR